MATVLSSYKLGSGLQRYLSDMCVVNPASDCPLGDRRDQKILLEWTLPRFGGQFGYDAAFA